MRLILASASPRRQELLRLITEDFTVRVSRADETTQEKDPAAMVRELAEKKARAVAAEPDLPPDAWIIGADTVVWAKGQILGKPKDEADALRMMRLLSGGSHEVHTGLCVIAPGRVCTESCRTLVHFAALSPAELAAYMATGDWADKAGAYGIQSAAARFVTGIEGCYYNVMGFPVQQLYALLRRMGARF